MRHLKIFLISLFLITTALSCSQNHSLNHENLFAAIHDEDTRKNVGFRADEYPPSKQSQATAMILLTSEIKRQHLTLGKAKALLCDDEKFLTEPVVGFCSGVLIAPDRVLTAGHCFRTLAECKNSSFVFGYTSEKNREPFAKQTFYGCKNLIAHENTRGTDIYGVDFAVVELDRVVDNIDPVQVLDGRKNPPTEDSKVISLSYPLGLPLKQDIAQLTNADRKSNFLQARVDTFSGSSGSPLFNAEGVLLGILSHGADDENEDEVYEARRENSCYRFQRCNKSSLHAGCRSENYYKAWLIPL